MTRQELFNALALRVTRENSFADVVLDEVLSLRQQLAAAQAQIDALMLEFCPEEMTKEQLDEWAKNQRVISEAEAFGDVKIEKEK